MYRALVLVPSLYRNTPRSDMNVFKLVHYEARMVGKQVVGILVEYFLACMYIDSMEVTGDSFWYPPESYF